MPPTVHARGGASQVAAQAYGATTHVLRIRAHRPGRRRPFGAGPRHASCTRNGGSERRNGANQPLHRPFPHPPNDMSVERDPNSSRTASAFTDTALARRGCRIANRSLANPVRLASKGCQQPYSIGASGQVALASRPAVHVYSFRDLPVVMPHHPPAVWLAVYKRAF